MVFPEVIKLNSLAFTGEESWVMFILSVQMMLSTSTHITLELLLLMFLSSEYLTFRWWSPAEQLWGMGDYVITHISLTMSETDRGKDFTMATGSEKKKKEKPKPTNKINPTKNNPKKTLPNKTKSKQTTSLKNKTPKPPGCQSSLFSTLKDL